MLIVKWSLDRPPLKLSWNVATKITTAYSNLGNIMQTVTVLLGPKGNTGNIGPVGPQGPAGNISADPGEVLTLTFENGLI